MISRKKELARKVRGKWSSLVGIVVSIFCIWWLAKSAQWDQVLSHASSVKISHIIIAVIVMSSGYLLRAIRWKYFFVNNVIQLFASYRVLIIGFFFNNVLPARLGELVRAQFGGKAVGISRAHVLGTIAAERLADGIMISGFLLFLFGVDNSSSAVVQVKALYYVALLFFLIGLVTAIVLFSRRFIFQIIDTLKHLLPGKLSNYTLVRLRWFIEGLEGFRHPKSFTALFIFSIAVWVVELYCYNQVALAYNLPLTLAQLAVFLAAVNFSSLIPAAPGGIGVIEAVSSSILSHMGINYEIALSMVATQHVIQYMVVGVPGSFFFFKNLGGKLAIDNDKENESAIVKQDTAVTSLSDKRIQAGVLEPSDIYLSIVVPAFNEATRLPNAILDMQSYCKQAGFTYEIIIVDDGSSDRTIEVVNKFKEVSPELKLLSLPRNRGKGYAVKFGVLNSSGKYVIYADADGATPFSEIERLITAIKEGADIAIGSRALKTKDTSINTVWYRKVMGRVFNGIVNLVVLPGVSDTQCGFKLFTREAAFKVVNLQKEERFSFDVELLYLARKFGYQIKEVAVNWHNVPGSKVRLVNDSAKMFVDIFRIKCRSALGSYPVP